MEQYGKILMIATPAFMILILFEKWYGWVKGKDTVRTMDMLSSLSSGVTNAVKDVLGLSITILTYGWLLRHLAIFEVKSSVFVFVVAFFVLDFQGYWVHRIAHRVNFFWNKHAIHHSSEEFNLACALRQSISSFVNIFTFFLIPAAILGVPASVIGVVAPLHLFAQFWYHTQHIDKMGFVENILVTPSHHRVHHAINKEYMDKNFAQIFIFWDKLFGTFQAEIKEIPPVYGITRPAQTWNPIKINFQHLSLLIKDAWRAENGLDKFRIWFMPTGWRPADVEVRFPVNKIENTLDFEKYDVKSSCQLTVWLWCQFLITLTLSLYFFGHVMTIGSPNMFIYGGFLYLSIYSFTELMDRNAFALIWETVKNIVGLGIIYWTGDWFGVQNSFVWAKYLIAFYFIFSTIVTAFFVFKEIGFETSKMSELSY